MNDNSVIHYTTYPDGHALATVDDYLRGGDITMLNYVEDMGAKFYDTDGTEKDPLDIMKENGVNIVRLRLYNNPGQTVSYKPEGGSQLTYALPSGYAGETDILNLARRAKAHNMKIELTFHYSDFWTNGEMQFKPKDWENYNFDQLKTAVYDYTYNFLQKMNGQGTPPDYVSLGNEIQGGLLFGYYTSDKKQINQVNGYCENMSNVAALLARGSAAVRDACPNSKVVIHLTLSTSVTTDTYAWFFNSMKSYNLDYDVIGASYYPYWTNQRPTMLNELANSMYSSFNKELLIMEVGYSWTPYRPSGRYGGNYEGQLSLNGTPYNEASKAGQKSFMQEVQTVVKNNEHILGYLYWDPVMVEQKVNGSWIQTGWVQGGGNMVGNTTWFDYEGKMLPVFEIIVEEAPTVPQTVTIDDRLYIVERQEPYTMIMSSVGYGTFYDDYARLLPEGISAYCATNVTDSKMRLTSIDNDNIPASTPVVLKGNEGTYYFWLRDEDRTIDGNILSGTATAIPTPPGNILTLAKENGEIGFYHYVDNTIPAHKAYYISTSDNQVLSFSFEDDTNGIDNCPRVETRNTEEIFNLQGQRVSSMQKGHIYIIGKKKTIVR